MTNPLYIYCIANLSDAPGDASETRLPQLVLPLLTPWPKPPTPDEPQRCRAPPPLSLLGRPSDGSHPLLLRISSTLQNREGAPLPRRPAQPGSGSSIVKTSPKILLVDPVECHGHRGR